jgi:hypothetical protein
VCVGAANDGEQGRHRTGRSDAATLLQAQMPIRGLGDPAVEALGPRFQRPRRDPDLREHTPHLFVVERGEQ